MAEQLKTQAEAERGHHHAHEHKHDGTCDHIGDFPQIESIHNKDVLVKEDILAKTRELADVIFQSEEVQQYRRAEQKINGNSRIQELIQAIKKKQKEVVAFETTFKNPDMVRKIEAEMAALQDELDAMPIVEQFQQSQSDINYLLQLVVSIVRDTVAEKINVEDASIADPEDCSD